MLDRLDRALQPLMRAIEEDAADSSTVSAMLAIEDRRARLLGIYELARFSDSGEDLGSLAGLNTELTRLRILLPSAAKNRRFSRATPLKS